MDDTSVTIEIKAVISQFKAKLQEAKNSLKEFSSKTRGELVNVGKTSEEVSKKSKRNLTSILTGSFNLFSAISPQFKQIEAGFEGISNSAKKSGEKGKMAMAGMGAMILVMLAGVIADAIKKAWDTLKKWVQKADPIGFEQIMSKMQASIDKMESALGTALMPVFEEIADFVTSIANGITVAVEWLMRGISYARGLLGSARIVNSTLSDTADALEEATEAADEGLAGFDKLNTLGDLSVSGLAESEKLQEMMDNAYDSGQDLSSSIYDMFSAIPRWGASAWASVKSAGSTAWEGIKSAGTTVWNALSVAGTTVWDGLKSAGSTAWDTVSGFGSTVYNKLAKLFGGIWDGLKDAFRSVANVIIGLINKVIRGYNSTIGSLNVDVLGYKLGFPKLGEISELATGGVVQPNDPHLVLMGDNKREEEVVSPVSTMKQAFKEAMSESSSSGPVTINLTLDSRTVAKAVYDPIKQEARRRGITGTL